MSEPDGLAPAEAIRALVARYARCVDSGRFGDLRDLFTDDAVLEVGDARFVGVAAILGLFDTARAQVALRGSGTVRHHLTTHDIELAPGRTRAEATLYFLVQSDIGLDHWGTYRDRYERATDGQWRFAGRVVRVDGRSPDSVFGTG